MFYVDFSHRKKKFQFSLDVYNVLEFISSSFFSFFLLSFCVIVIVCWCSNWNITAIHFLLLSYRLLVIVSHEKCMTNRMNKLIDKVDGNEGSERREKQNFYMLQKNDECRFPTNVVHMRRCHRLLRKWASYCMAASSNCGARNRYGNVIVVD